MIHYYVNSNGPFDVSYYDSNFGVLNRVIRLSSYPHGDLHDILSAVCLKAQQEDMPVEVVHNCLDDSIQGLILPERSVGVYAPEVWNDDELDAAAMLATAHIKAAQSALASARETFSRARVFHNEQEKIYLAQMDFSAADRVTEETIHMLLDGKSSGHEGREVHRFFGAATASGNIDHIPEVTADIPHRYFIKGRPGTGKSTFLKKIAQAALEQGYFVERYHCSLDPNSLDLIAVRELGFCLLDSTAPHEYFPVRDGDEIIDLYEACVTPGTDEKYAAELQQLGKAYKNLVVEAVESLKSVQQFRDSIEKCLPQLSDTSLEQAKDALLERLFPV